MTSSEHMEKLWNVGQHLLGQGRYVAARSFLERAEALAWRRRDAQSLARLYLPLLEVRRQIRYDAAEGVILICSPSGRAREEAAWLDEFVKCETGTALLACSAGEGEAACRFAGSVGYAARRTGRRLEALVLVKLAEEVRLAPAAEPLFAAGLRVAWTKDSAQQIGDATAERLEVPLPPPGWYAPDAAMHGVARESLIVGWEALALKWQRRHPPPAGADAWEEMAWLRLALRVDPACEPVSMRLMALAEAVLRVPAA